MSEQKVTGSLELAQANGVRRHMATKKTGKVEKVMKEFKAGTLRSGSATRGPKVVNWKQAVAIAMSEERRAKGQRKK